MHLKKFTRLAAVCIMFVMLFSACTANEKELTARGENNFPAPSSTAEELIVMTYNIKNCENANSISVVASDIRAHNPSVVCVQEIDNGTKRSGKKDVLKLLAQELEMNYCFYPVLNYQGGLYGIGIMSVYPLENCQMQFLETRKGDEARVLASADIKTPNKTLHIYNTHLSYENKEARLNQIKWISSTLKDNDSFILTGDFNIESFEEYAAFDGMRAVNTSKEPFETFIGEPESGDFFRAIDNIFVSDNIELDNIVFGQTSVSDHRPLIAQIEL